MYCPECGNQIEDTAKFCKFCGHQIQYGQTDYSQNDYSQNDYSQNDYSDQTDSYQTSSYQSYDSDMRDDYHDNHDDHGYVPFDQQQSYYNYHNETTYPEDKVSILFTVLSFLIPLIGFILYFVWRNKTPNKAQACLYAALASVIMNIVIMMFN